MKKKQGFTLIELLAVIIILAVIALIATPIILNIIERARISAAEASAKGYAEAVNYVIIDKNFVNQGDYDGTYDVIENKLGASYDGQGPSKGFVRVEKNRVTYGELCINGYPIKYENGYGKYDPESTICETGTTVPKEPEGEEAYKLCTGEVNYDEVTNFKIKKVEDLVCISQQAKDEKTFEGKNVLLLNDIDINNSSSYIDASAKFYGDVDINGNGTPEDIKTELTTEKGFLPIGSYKTAFNGTFEGNAYTISNLYINRPDTNYVGLIGYISSGTIIGLNAEDFDITGNNYVGGIVGYSNTSSGTIEDITFEGSVTGNYRVGGIAGATSGTIKKINIKNAIVEGNDELGHTGGIVGYNSGTIEEIVIEGITVTASGYAVGGIVGYDTNSAIIQEVTVKNAIIENLSEGDVASNTSNTGGILGYSSGSTIKGIIFEGSVTGNHCVGGISGRNGNISDVLIKNTIVTGTGTCGTGGVIGSHAIGTIEGIDIDNITINGDQDVGGVAGYSQEIVRGVNVKNANITGRIYVGGIVGNGYGTVKEVIFEGNVSGTTVGGVIGNGSSSSNTENVLVRNVNITGGNYVGGIVGSGSASGIIETGIITQTNSIFSNIGKISGDNGDNSYSTSSVTIVTSKEYEVSNDGTDFPISNINNLSYYSTLLYNGNPILETAETGDVDGSGFYFAYGSDGKIKVVKAQ